MEVFLVFLSLEQQHLASIGSHYDPILTQPAVAQEILRLYLLDGVGLQGSLVILVRLEDAIPDNTELSVIIRVEGYLSNVDRVIGGNMRIPDNYSSIVQPVFK